MDRRWEINEKFVSVNRQLAKQTDRDRWIDGWMDDQEMVSR